MFVKMQCYISGKIRIISYLKLKFHLRFLDFKADEKLFSLFSIPISLSVEDVPKNNMQMEIIDLQNNTILKEKI